MKPAYYKMFDVPDRVAWDIMCHSAYAYVTSNINFEQEVSLIRGRVDEQLYSCIEKHFMV